MRHRNHSQRLARKPDQARSILKNLATSILLYERVRTTKKRAQVVRGVVENIIIIGKKKRTDLAIRHINTLVSDENACRKVLEVLKQRYDKRPSGFTRITPLGMRSGDGALLCEIALVDAVAPVVLDKKTESASAKKKPEAKATAKKKLFSKKSA